MLTPMLLVGVLFSGQFGVFSRLSVVLSERKTCKPYCYLMFQRAESYVHGLITKVSG